MYMLIEFSQTKSKAGCICMFHTVSFPLMVHLHRSEPWGRVQSSMKYRVPCRNNQNELIDNRHITNPTQFPCFEANDHSYMLRSISGSIK